MKSGILQFGVLSASCLFMSLSQAAAPTAISVAEFSKDPVKVAALKKGISLMQQASAASPTSAEFRTSFTYWANTHGYFGIGKHGTNMAQWLLKRVPGCLSYMGFDKCNEYYQHMQASVVPDDGFTNEVWGTCQHGNLNFLPWHRLYLHFFNRTLRKHIGDPNFVLPYWNYFDNYDTVKQGLFLPELVTSANGNPLFDPWRSPGLNQRSSPMDAKAASAKQAFKFNDFTNFANSLEQQPHGLMHCAVGSDCSAPDIGFVPIAGLDPVFYMHHTNIDRLWQCWLKKKAKGKTIDLAWAKANLGMPDAWYDTAFTFADENGNKATMTIADVFIPGKVEVSYDNLDQCELEPISNKSLLRAAAVEGGAAKPVLLNTPLRSKLVKLGNRSLTVNLTAEPTLNKLNDKLTTSPVNDASPQDIHLILKDVQMQGAPVLTYAIYLVSKKQPSKTSYVATISYFGADAHQHHGQPAGSLGDMTYHVNDNLRELGLTNGADASVKFVPVSLSGAAKSIKQDANSGLSVGVIQIQKAQPQGN